MSSVNLVVLVESVQELTAHAKEERFYLPSLIAVAIALGASFGLLPFPPHMIGCLTPRIVGRREDHPVHLLLWVQGAVEPGACAVRGPPERYLHQRLRFVHNPSPPILEGVAYRGLVGLVMAAGGSKWVWCKHSTLPAPSVC